MIFYIFIGVLVLYFSPLALFLTAIFTSKNFHLHSELVRVLVGMGDQVQRIRDLIERQFAFLSLPSSASSWTVTLLSMRRVCRLRLRSLQPLFWH